MAIDGSQGQESRIFIGNVDPKIDKDKIKSRFSLHGKVSDIKVLRGYAFVQFEKSIEAQTAISRENGTIFDDKTIEVKNAVINKVEEIARPAPSSTMIANKDENTFKKPKPKSKLNMKTLNYIFQNFGDENNELMVKFRRMLLIVAAKNSDLVAEERIKTGTPQSTIRYFVEAAVNPTKEKFSQVNDRHELGQDFLLEMINALRQMEDEYVVAENLLGARYSDVKEVIEDMKKSHPFLFYRDKLNRGTRKNGIIKCVRAAIVILERSAPEKFAEDVSKAEESHKLAKVFIQSFRQLILKKVQERINRLFIVSGMNRQKCEKCQACQTEDGKKCIICKKYRSPDTCPNDCCFNPKATKPIKNEPRKYRMSDVEDKISDLLKDVDTHVVTRFPLDKPENASPLHRIHSNPNMEPIGGFRDPRYSPNPNYEIGRGEVENNNESTNHRCDRTTADGNECNQYFTDHTEFWRHYADHDYHNFGYMAKREENIETDSVTSADSYRSRRDHRRRSRSRDRRRSKSRDRRRSRSKDRRRSRSRDRKRSRSREGRKRSRSRSRESFRKKFKENYDPKEGSSKNRHSSSETVYGSSIDDKSDGEIEMVGISDPNFSVKPAGPASKKPDTEIEIVDLDDSENDGNRAIETSNQMEIPLNIPVGANKKKKSAFIDFGSDDEIDPDEFKFEFQNIVKSEPKIEMKEENNRKKRSAELVKDENRRNLDDISEHTFQSDSTTIKDEIKFEIPDESIKKE